MGPEKLYAGDVGAFFTNNAVATSSGELPAFNCLSLLDCLFGGSLAASSAGSSIIVGGPGSWIAIVVGSGYCFLPPSPLVGWRWVALLLLSKSASDLRSLFAVPPSGFVWASKPPYT